MYVWLGMLMFVFVKDCDLYGRVTKRVFSYLEAIQLASSCMLDHVRGFTLSDGQIWGLKGHLCVCVYVCMCVWLIPWDWNRLGVSLLFTFGKQSGGVNTAVAGTCVQDCTQYVHMASVLGEVQECEIRRWFVEGDNEQSGILTGWALGCKLQSCYTLSDFNHFKLFF